MTIELKCNLCGRQFNTEPKFHGERQFFEFVRVSIPDVARGSRSPALEFPMDPFSCHYHICEHCLSQRTVIVINEPPKP